MSSAPSEVTADGQIPTHALPPNTGATTAVLQNIAEPASAIGLEQAQQILQQMASLGILTGSMRPSASPLAPPAAASEAPTGQGVWEAAARYRALVEKIPAVTFMAALDENLHELYVSPQIQTLLGYTQAEWLGDPFLWYTRLHPDDRERWQQEFALTCTSGVHFRSEYRFLARDGHVVWVHGECQVIRDEEGRPLFLQGIAFDITESKRAEEALQQMHRSLEVMVRERTAELADANESLREEIAKRKELETALQNRAKDLSEEGRRKDHFLAVLAHELRNPLAPITTALQLLRREGLGPDERAWAEGMMEQQVSHLTRLVDDLLDISRVTLGKIGLRKEPTDLALVVSRACEAARPFLWERRHELSVSTPPGPIPVVADVTRLEQIAVNLMTNAAKFTEPGGRISISAAREGKEAVLRVHDTGVGIPPEMLDNIFELFTQVDSSVSRTSQWGLGIGLALVRGLVELHGGTIKAHSDGPGHGSEFTVRLPLAVAPAVAETPKPATPPAPARQTTRRNILVVEDRPEFARTLAMLLRMWGHEVRIAGNGPQALEAVHAAAPEVVLLDIGLPGMDGYQVAQEMRRHPELSKTLLVALTGYGRDEDRRRTAEAGFDHHLTKPVMAEALQELLARSERN